MSKIDIEEVQNVLEQRKVANTADIMKDLQQILEELAAEKEANKEDKPKFEYLVIVHDPSGKLKAEKQDEVLSAFVVQQEEGEDAGLVLSKIADAAKLQNEMAKNKKQRLQNMRDVFDGLKSKYLKEKKVKIKTKEPVRIILTQGNMNTEPPKGGDE